ncbi:hypothetical protein OPQ81_001130 [Rhizoctonia solani]|nr:hypothetical protein OPQ81_001130 [Rhizoctonia solani]
MPPHTRKHAKINAPGSLIASITTLESNAEEYVRWSCPADNPDTLPPPDLPLTKAFQERKAVFEPDHVIDIAFDNNRLTTHLADVPASESALSNPPLSCSVITTKPQSPGNLDTITGTQSSTVFSVEGRDAIIARPLLKTLILPI